MQIGDPVYEYLTGERAQATNRAGYIINEDGEFVPLLAGMAVKAAPAVMRGARNFMGALAQPQQNQQSGGYGNPNIHATFPGAGGMSDPRQMNVTFNPLSPNASRQLREAREALNNVAMILGFVQNLLDSGTLQMLVGSRGEATSDVETSSESYNGPQLAPVDYQPYYGQPNEQNGAGY